MRKQAPLGRQPVDIICADVSLCGGRALFRPPYARDHRAPLLVGFLVEFGIRPKSRYRPAGQNSARLVTHGKEVVLEALDDIFAVSASDSALL